MGISYASVPGIDLSSTAYQRVWRLLSDSGAPASSNDSKRARTSSSAPVFAFGDSSFILEGSHLFLATFITFCV